jgi:hypothetical protein
VGIRVRKSRKQITNFLGSAGRGKGYAIVPSTVDLKKRHHPPLLAPLIGSLEVRRKLANHYRLCDHRHTNTPDDVIVSAEEFIVIADSSNVGILHILGQRSMQDNGYSRQSYFVGVAFVSQPHPITHNNRGKAKLQSIADKLGQVGMKSGFPADEHTLFKTALFGLTQSVKHKLIRHVALLATSLRFVAMPTFQLALGAGHQLQSKRLPAVFLFLSKIH